MREPSHKRITGTRIAGLLLGGSLLLAAPAAAQTGGTVSPTSPPPPPPPQKATLLANGKAIAPPNAPERVVRAIQAGNRIRKKPYVYGGGHATFASKGYDCSGAVSYVLHAAGMLKSPLPSGPLMKWGMKGRGAWITVFANGGHAYAVIAGLRWDTSAVNEPLNSGSGPRWRRTKRSPKGYRVRHFPKY
jgi:hypothetical protein